MTAALIRPDFARKQVRQRQDAPPPIPERPCEPIVLADLSQRVRICSDGRQWLVMVRKGRADAKATGWRARRWCLSRTGLRLAIRDLCGDVDPDALAIIDRLPELHP